MEVLLLVLVLGAVVWYLHSRQKEEAEQLRRELVATSERLLLLEKKFERRVSQEPEDRTKTEALQASRPPAAALRPELAPREPSRPPLVLGLQEVAALAAQAPVVASPPPAIVTPVLEKRPEPVLPPKPPAPAPVFTAATAAQREDLETRFGTLWLSRIGAGILVLGVALFLTYAFANLGPWGKIGLAYGTSASMMAAGFAFEKREKYRLYGRALLASGWALAYFITYALHNVDAVRKVESEWMDLALLFLVATGMIGHSLRYRSQAVTGFAYLLAYLTVAISHVTFYSLGALAVLTVSMGIILWRQNWFEMELVGMAGAYLCHLSLGGAVDAVGRRFAARAEFFTSAFWLAAYWLTFNFVHLARRALNEWQGRLSHITVLANAFLFLGLLRYQARLSGLAFWALLAAGAIYLLFAAAAQRRVRRTSFLLFATLGVALIFAAVPLRFTGGRLTGLWLVEAAILLLAGFLLSEIHFRRLAWLAMAVSCGYLLFRDWTEVVFGDATQPEGSAALFCLAAALAYTTAYWVAHRFSGLLKEEEHYIYRGYSYLAALFLTLALWRSVPAVWLAPAWAVAMLILAEAGTRGQKLDLRHQARALSVLAGGWCLYYGLLASPGLAAALGISLRWPTGGAVAAALYYLHIRWRKRAGESWADQHRDVFSYLSYGATVLVMVLLNREIPDRYVAVAYLAAGLALAEAGARIGDGALRSPGYGTVLVGAVGLMQLNLPVPDKRLPLMSGFTAGLLWLAFRVRAWISRSAAREWESIVAAAATYAAAGIAAALLSAEASRLWLAPGLAALALVWAAPGLWMGLRHFRYAAGLLHVGAIGAALAVNLPDAGRHWLLSERAWTVLAVAALTYLLSYLVDQWRNTAGPAERREARWGAVQCWTGTGLLALLAWYDMRPVAVAVAWSLLGVVCTEIGSVFRREQLRQQGYLLSLAAFARLFVSNLSASTPVAGVSARVWTVGLLVLFFYYQFLRLRVDLRHGALSGREAAAPEVYSWLGLAALAALLRFELSRPWVAVAWALLGSVVLILGTLRADRQFRFQAYVLGVAVAVRTALNNFYLLETYGGVSARLITVSGIVVMLFGCFFLIQFLIQGAKLAGQPATEPLNSGRLRAALWWADRYSKYLYFFVATGLLTAQLAIEVRSGLLTPAWGLEGLALFLCGLAIGERPFRLSGLALLVVCIGRIFLIDLSASNLLYRIASFLVLGAVLLAVSFLYTRYRERLNRYL